MYSGSLKVFLAAESDLNIPTACLIYLGDRLRSCAPGNCFDEALDEWDLTVLGNCVVQLEVFDKLGDVGIAI